MAEMSTARQNTGQSAMTAIVIGDSDDDIRPPAKRRKTGPFVDDSDSDTVEDDIDAKIRERIAALKTEDMPLKKDPDGEARFASRSKAPATSQMVFRPEKAATAPKTDLATFLATTIPSHLISAPNREIIVEMFNARLDLAESEHVALASMVIGEDCLPTWPLRPWGDSMLVKEALEWRVFAQGLGDDTRKLIREKIQRRLEQAVEQGMEVIDLVMSEELRLVWRKGGFLVDEGRDGDGQVLGMDAEGDLGMGEESRRTQDSGYFTERSQSSSPDGDLNNDENLLEPTQTTEIVPLDYDADDDASGTDQDDNATHGRLAQRIVRTRDLRDLKPVGRNYYSSSSSESDDVEDEREEEEQHHNIFYDAEVVGGEPDFQSMDFEVYLAPNDADLDDMPELEVMIDDGEAYEFHHPEAATVIFDFPLPDGHVMHVTDEHLAPETLPEATDRAEEHGRIGYPHLPSWAHPDEVLEGIKDKHWTRASKARRDRWQRAIDKALAMQEAQGEEVEDIEETDEEALGCENEEKVVSDESDVSVEDESGDEAFKPVKRKVDEVLGEEGESGGRRVAFGPKEGVNGVVENWLDRRVETELSDLMEKLGSGPASEEGEDMNDDDGKDENLFEDVV